MTLHWRIAAGGATILGWFVGLQFGGFQAAMLLALGGFFLVQAIEDFKESGHAFIAVTVLAALGGFNFLGVPGAVLAAVLAFAVQLTVYDFQSKKSALFPVALALTALAFAATTFLLQANILTALGVSVFVFLVSVACDDYFLQRKHAVRRNFPLIGWFRYGLEIIGDELRQYWFMSDTEERPYDRETRRFIYRTAKGLDRNIPFGTVRDYGGVGQIHLLHKMYPVSEQSACSNSLPAIVIGKNRRTPYVCPSPINISGMSFGALSPEAVQALSSGAKMANIHILTGEGGTTPYHIDGVIKRVTVTQLTRYWRERAANVLSFGMKAKPSFPRGEVVGGGRIICQLGAGKFGFRRVYTDVISTAGERGFRKRFTSELDWDKLVEFSRRDQVVAFEIKLHQGAKPGQGGHLPAAKNSPELASFRGVEAWTDVYSPNLWDEFNDVPSMFAFLKKIQDLTGKPVGIKIAVGQDDDIRAIAKLMSETKEGPDFITIDGGEGGTGSAPVALADSVGLPILLAIPEVDNIFRQFGVRNDIVLIASGRFAKPNEIAIAIALGADMVNIARANMIASGCIMARRCHTNTCPVGIATQDPRYRRALDPEDKYVKIGNYNRALQRDLIMILRAIGVSNPWELTRGHVSVVVSPMVKKTMAEINPYPDNSNGARNHKLLDTCGDNDPLGFDHLGPKLLKLNH